MRIKRETAPEVAAKVKPQVRVCQFAGDEADEFCVVCNGTQIEVDGKKFEATECGGYAATEEVIEEKEIEKPEVIEKIVEKAKPAASKPVASKPAASKPVETTPETTQNTAADAEPQDEGNYIPKAVTTLIRADSGVSVELKDKKGLTHWYKFAYAEERTVTPDCNIELEKKQLWADVNETVDDQVEATMDYLQTK